MLGCSHQFKKIDISLPPTEVGKNADPSLPQHQPPFQHFGKRKACRHGCCWGTCRKHALAGMVHFCSVVPIKTGRGSSRVYLNRGYNPASQINWGLREHRVSSQHKNRNSPQTFEVWGIGGKGEGERGRGRGTQRQRPRECMSYCTMVGAFVLRNVNWATLD